MVVTVVVRQRSSESPSRRPSLKRASDLARMFNKLNQDNESRMLQSQHYPFTRDQVNIINSAVYPMVYAYKNLNVLCLQFSICEQIQCAASEILRKLMNAIFMDYLQLDRTQQSLFKIRSIIGDKSYLNPNSFDVPLAYQSLVHFFQSMDDKRVGQDVLFTFANEYERIYKCINMLTLVCIRLAHKFHGNSGAFTMRQCFIDHADYLVDKLEYCIVYRYVMEIELKVLNLIGFELPVDTLWNYVDTIHSVIMCNLPHELATTFRQTTTFHGHYIHLTHLHETDLCEELKGERCLPVADDCMLLAASVIMASITNFTTCSRLASQVRQFLKAVTNLNHSTTLSLWLLYKNFYATLPQWISNRVPCNLGQGQQWQVVSREAI